MLAVRRILVHLVVAGLSWQAVAIALPPAMLWATPATSCTCSTGDHAMCPMHHRQSTSNCAIRAAEDGAPMLIGFAFVGVVAPAAVGVVIPRATRSSLPLDRQSFTALRLPPDLPPPRA